LYEKETGIKISENTAKNQKGKWILINGELYRKKKTKPKLTIINEPAKETENRLNFVNFFYFYCDVIVNRSDVKNKPTECDVKKM